VTALLSVTGTPENGRRAYRRLCDRTVDLNEIRVSSTAEIAGVIKDLVPGSTVRAKALADTLNAIFRHEYRVDLSGLRSIGRREAKHYLEKLNGIDPYTTASVLLWSLGGHAIPVSGRLLEFLRANDLVAPESDVAEIQSFLERHVSANDAKLFCHLMERRAASEPRGGHEKRAVDAAPAQAEAGKRKKAKPPA
jgi:endonuclease III